MGTSDFRGVIEQGVDAGQPEHMRLGPRSKCAKQASTFPRQLRVDPFHMTPASASRLISPTPRAKSTTFVSRRMSGAESRSSQSPPSGKSLERLTQTHKFLFPKPLTLSLLLNSIKS